ncbi:MAG: preprotein translocase subunit SecA [Paludibacteraceae bacterium]|nr:preprotein translocase subunit SecA [Paludibacteraceae bacterium]MBP6284108.1 preprotein translocase subunit SecA [Paludibacteraceae bacterium]
MGFSSILSTLFGSKSQRDLKEIIPFIDKIKEVYPQIEQLSTDALRTRLQAIRTEIQEYVSSERSQIESIKESIEGTPIEDREQLYNEIDALEKVIVVKLEEALDNALPEVFAVVKDTARRFKENETITVDATNFDRELALSHDFVHIENDKAIYQNEWMAGGSLVKWDMVHYDVQLIGGVVLHKGKIAEMTTGEGKTLVATLPVFLNALSGNGVHVVTVNDYLSKRDSEWMGPIYMFHGLRVDCIDKHRPNSDDRRAAYLADITFGTNNEFGFDYLRDNMASTAADLVQRKHNYSIVDEVDSVLIDDARTPLIISGPVAKGEEQLFEEYCSKVERIVAEQKNLVTKTFVEARKLMQSADNKEQEKGSLLLFRSFKGLPKSKAIIKYLSEPGVKSSMLKTEAVYMEQNNRRMPEVTDDLYFVINEQHNTIELTDKGIDLITGDSDDSQFFVLPDIGSEIAEIEKATLSDEEKQAKKDILMQEFSVKSERVHTINQLLKAYTLFEKDDQYVVMNNKVMIVDEQTGRVMEGRRYSDGLHQAIEAKERVKVEAATQTYATITLQNYFRMYNKLSGMTGTAETEAGELWDIYKLDVVVIPTNRPIVRNDMNDRVYKTARAKYNAVIEETEKLVAAGRPVLVGTTSVETSELVSKLLKMRKIPHNVLNAKLHQKEADIVAQAGKSGTVTIATNMAGRGTDIKLSAESKAAGGLAIIGTERHESRRIDRQLRGRSGRQGDPGSSVFFVSFEDSLMRLFGSDRIVGIMDRLGLEENEMMEHRQISNSIERAQKKVEENNFGIRKRLLEYDDVMNSQREVIYARRKHALIGERIGIDIVNMIYDGVENMVSLHADFQDEEELRLDCLKLFGVDILLEAEEIKRTKTIDLVEKIFATIIANFTRRANKLAEIAYPVVKKVYEEQGTVYENIQVPLTDGKRLYNIPVNLKLAYETEGKEIVKSFQKSILLHTIDEAWKEHLRELDELRNSVQNASYEQKDPLLIYKLESFGLFKKMIDAINYKAIAILMRGQIPVKEGETLREAKQERRQDYSKYSTQKSDIMSAGQQDTREKQHKEPIRVDKKVGRNDLCPCGSGKKYKSCCGKV